MATLAKLDVILGFKDDGFDSGMAGAKSRLDDLGRSMQAAGRWMTTRVTLPLVAAGGAAIKWASDLDESINKTSVLFGDATKDVVAFSEGSATSLGMSQQATLDYASSYAGMLNTVAQGPGELADMSMAMTQLTSDFASFHNLNPADAFTVLASALAGETEAIRRYGVDVSAAAVEQEALAMGLASSSAELTEQDKLLARYSLILKQTKEEQGDFARTSKSTSNQFKILRARIQDVGAAFGKHMLPFVNRALSAMLDMLGLLDNLDPKWQKVILAIAAFAAALGPVLIVLGMLLPGLGALATVIGFLLSPIGLLVIAIAALIGLGIYAWVNDLWGVRDAVDAVVDALQVFRPMLGDLYDAFQALREGDFSEVFDELREALRSFVDGLMTLAAQVWPAVRDALLGLLGSIPLIGDELVRFANWLFGTAIPAIISFAGTVRDWITGTAIPALQDLWTKVQPYLDDLKNALVWLVARIAAFAADVKSFITGTAIPALQDLWTKVQPYLDDLKNALVWLVARIAAFAADVKSFITRTAIPALQDLWTKVQPYLDDLKNALVWLIARIAAFASDVKSFITGTAIPALQDLWTLVEPKLTSLANKLVTVAGYIIAFASDAKTYAGQVKDAFVGLWDDIEAKWSNFTGSSIYKFLTKVAELAKEAIDLLGQIPGSGVGDAAGSGQVEPWNDPRRYEPQRSGQAGSSEGAGGAFNNGVLIHTLPAVGTGSSTFLSQIATQVQTAAGSIASLATNIANSLRQVGTGFQQAGQTVTTAVQQMRQRVQQAFQQMQQITQQVTTQIRSVVMQAWQQVQQQTQTMATQVAMQFQQMASRSTTQMQQLRTQVVSAMQQMAAQASAAMSQFASQVQSGFQRAVAAAQSGASQIRSVVAGLNLGSQGYSIGASLGQGIAAGIQAYIGTVAAAAAALVSAAINAAQIAAQARSPSRVMMALGGDMAEGLTIGLERGAASVWAATESLIRSPDASTGAAGGAPVVHNHSYYSVTPEDLRALIDGARAGGEFAVNFGRELGLYAGTP